MSSGTECHPELARHIGGRIRAARMLKKLSRPTLGARIGVTGTSIYYWERGEHQISATRLSMLSVVLDRPLDYFIDGFPPQDVAPHPGME